jgi:hypothetical protein
VVVTDHPDAAASGSAAGALLAEALHQAFAEAADPKAFPEQLDRLGLQPWRAARLYGLWDKREGATVVVDDSRDLPRLEGTAHEHAEPAAGLLVEARRAVPAERYYRQLDGPAAGAAALHSLMAGVPPPAPGEARRKLPKLAELPPEVARANQLRRNLITLANRPVAGLADLDKLLPPLAAKLKGLPEDQAVAALLAVANGCARQGQWALAREAHLLLVERYPAHPRTVESYRWLIRLGTSGEARRRRELGHFFGETGVSEGKPDGEH